MKNHRQECDVGTHVCRCPQLIEAGFYGSQDENTKAGIPQGPAPCVLSSTDCIFVCMISANQPETLSSHLCNHPCMLL